MEVSIRRMTRGDIAAICDIYGAVLEPSYISFSELGDGKAEAPGRVSPHASEILRKQLEQLADEPGRGFFVAVADGRVVGFQLASLHAAPAGHVECWLDDCCIRSGWQGRGVASALIGHACQWARDHEARYVLFESGVRNARMHRLGEHLGFAPLATVFCREL